MGSSDFNPCIIIPVFNHAQILRENLPQISRFGVPIIIIDDGSIEKERLIIETLFNEQNVFHLRHEINSGKGAAIISGINEAERRGFTHALQIDADGQHDSNDIPKLIQRACDNPESLLLGEPIFDASAPLARIWGRKLTNGLLRLEGLNLSIKDGMCGFRVYPVRKLVRAIAGAKLQQRMGFDIEIVARMSLAGVPVLGVPTRVIYPEKGISNFRYLQDNLSLIALHSKLMVRMVAHTGRRVLLGKRSAPRLTKELSRNEATSESWHEKREHGAVLGLKFLLFLYRTGGKPLLRLILYPVVLYFIAKDRSARQASKEYLNNLSQFAPHLKISSSFRCVFHHFFNFGESMILSLQAWGNEIKATDIKWHNERQVFDLVDQKQGSLVLSAHFGCIESCRATHIGEKGLRIVPLMYLKNAEKFRSFLSQVNPLSAAEYIAVEEMSPAMAITIQNRVMAGDFIALLADRPAPGSPGRMIPVSFLGKTAYLPEGPFRLALTLDCPVFTLFASYDGKEGQASAFWERLLVTRSNNRLERRSKIQELAEAYAKRLEEICVRSPYQWFNFFSVWEAHGK